MGSAVSSRCDFFEMVGCRRLIELDVLFVECSHGSAIDLRYRPEKFQKISSRDGEELKVLLVDASGELE